MTHFKSLNIAVLTVSDSRHATNDTSGDTLVERITNSGHFVADKQIVLDNIYQIRATVSQLSLIHI